MWRTFSSSMSATTGQCFFDWDDPCTATANIVLGVVDAGLGSRITGLDCIGQVLDELRGRLCCGSTRDSMSSGSERIGRLSLQRVKDVGKLCCYVTWFVAICLEVIELVGVAVR